MEMERKDSIIIVLSICLIFTTITGILLSIQPSGIQVIPPELNTLTIGTSSGPNDLDPTDCWDAASNDVIEQVGPGGNYVMEEHTVEHMMDEFFYPSLSVRCNFDIWEERGRPDMLSRSRELVEKTLNEGRGSRLDLKLVQQIKDAFPDIVRI